MLVHRLAIHLSVIALLGVIPNHLLSQDSPGTVKVFVLAGQSNMQGHGVVDLDHPQHYNGGQGTLQQLLAKPEHQQRFGYLKVGDDWAVRDDVWVRYKTEREVKSGPLSIGFSAYEGNHHIGPELGVGHVLGDHFEQPVLLIKTAWGGKSLLKDFRSPSAVAAGGGEVGAYYQQMLKEVADAIEQAPAEFPELEKFKFEIAGFVWQQGWNDMVDETATRSYFDNLVHLINDVRETWNQPGLPVVVGELGNGGPDADDNLKRFRRQQSRIAAHPPFVGNVAFAETAQHARPAERSPNVGHGHHWFGNAESYLLVGESLGREMVGLLTRPSSPRILILGDSISIGYMPYVQKAFEGEAFVVRPMNNHRAAENCAGTNHGVDAIDRWLSIGGGNWDVIHFNFGLHDLKHVNPETGKNSNDPDDPEQAPPDVYRKQLLEIVRKLKSTEAKLIFATTTPVPEGGVKPYRDVASPERYNQIARAIMEEHEIAVNDLYSFANQQLADIQQPVNVHFTPDGSRALAEQVIRHLRESLD